MHNIEITTMSLEQIDDVMIVENLSFSIPWSRESLVEEVTKNKFARYICASYEGKIVGYAGMWKVYDEGHITNIAVHPEYRGQGIGNILLDTLIRIARKEGVTGMTLEVRKSNTIAQALYSNYGFEAAGIRKAYYADNGEDAVIMWKHM